MRFSPELLDDIRARLPVSAVVGRRVALKRAGREFRGLSPFKTEKTPSFFVNDQKGFYHCFASGEHGDIFKFVMTTEGLSFPEAVERLAQEAGVELPKPDRIEPQEAIDHRKRAYDLLEASARIFAGELNTSEGAAARDYLARRGLRPETIGEFRLGYAPANRGFLKGRLKALGYSIPEMIETGMLIGGEDIKDPYDRFRDRVMFPIHDLKGRVIAFGGRALSAEAPAKYLNSPETPLFHKGAVLFNAHRARKAAHDAQALIVVEGYMDAVALSEAGFAHVVAPLGTALTPDQVRLLWRFTPRPTLCFDGDSAGRRAAFRAVETVLPLVTPEHSLDFAFMPKGLDPDDLIRTQGPAAMAEVLKRPVGLFDVLLTRVSEEVPPTSPENLARLEARLRAEVAKVANETVARHYARALQDALYRFHRTRSQSARPAGGSGPPSAPFARRDGSPAGGGGWRERERMRTGLQAPKSQRGWPASGAEPRSPAPAPTPPDAVPQREAVLLEAVLNHPWLLDNFAETLAGLKLASPPLEDLKGAILSVDAEHAGENPLDSASLRSQLAGLRLHRSLDLVAKAVSRSCDRFAGPGVPVSEVEDGFRHVLELQHRASLMEALAGAESEWHAAADADAQELIVARIKEIQRLIASSGDNGGGVR